LSRGKRKRLLRFFPNRRIRVLFHYNALKISTKTIFIFDNIVCRHQHFNNCHGLAF